MDAKPLRGFKVHDENAVPGFAQKKSLHTRNKSSPALSTLAAKGALKMAAKRSAMGDVSQTARGNRPLREELVVGKDYKIQLQSEKPKSAALLQPAQRPLAPISVNSEAIGHIPIANSTEVPVPSKVKQVISKRATTIFKDYSTLSQPIQDLLKLDDSIVSPSVQEVQKDVVASKPHGRSSEDVGAEPVHDNANAIYLINEVSELEAVVSTKAPKEEIPINFQEPNLHSAPAQIELEPASVPEPQVAKANAELVKFESFEQAADKETLPSDELPDPQSKLLGQEVKPKERVAEPLVAKVSSSALPLEPEQFVEEEFEEEDNYEDDGFVTARSFRSKGDNITYTNVTTTLAPQSSANTRKEIEAAGAVVRILKPVSEIEDEAWDVSMVSEYKEEIFEYYKELEIKLSPNPHYMDSQTEIQWSMRSILVDWVVQVHDRFKLLPETLFLCVNLIDRFLSVKVVSINKLQLVGATAIFIAAKYEEVNCPSINEMLFMVDNGYSVEELLKAERFMLTLLQFDLGWPGPMSFLRRISTADDYDLETRTVAKYFLELTIMDERFLGCPPSYTAAGAHCLARMMLKKGHWSFAHVHYSGYTYAQLYPLLGLMMECLENPVGHHNAIFEKYLDKRFKGASHFARDEVVRGFRLMDPSVNVKHTFQNLCISSTVYEYAFRGVPGFPMPTTRVY